MMRQYIQMTVIAASLGGFLLAQTQTKRPVAKFQVLETAIDDIHAAMGSGKLTARQLVQAYFERIVAFDKQGPALNCIINLNPQALEEADKLDAAFKRSGKVGPLHGIPVLVKDEIDTAGRPTTVGTVVFYDYPPRRHASALDRLREERAVGLGKPTLRPHTA